MVNEQLRRRFDRMEATRRDVVAHLQGHDRERLNRPRADGGWSVLQVLHHVVAAEAGTRGYVAKKIRAGASLPRSGLASRLRRLVLRAVNASPLRFRAPAGAGDVPAEAEPADLVARWEDVRREWEQLLETFPEELLDRVVFRHGWVGLMGLPDTLEFLQSHLDHHARQVVRLLAPH